MVRFAIVTPCTLPPVQIPYGVSGCEGLVPAPAMMTSSRLFVAPRISTLVKVPLMYNDCVRVYVPRASTIVVFDRSALTAACNCGSVETFTTTPVGAARAGGDAVDRLNADEAIRH